MDRASLAAWTPWLFVLVGVAVGAVTDLRARRIPNALTGPLFLLALVWAIAMGGLPGLREAALGCLVAAGPFVFLFLFAGGGAGDAKLMGAVGAWLGVEAGLLALVYVFVVGIALAIYFAAREGKLWYSVKRVGQAALRLLLLITPHRRFAFTGGSGAVPKDSVRMPYGLAILIGVWATAVHACYYPELLW